MKDKFDRQEFVVQFKEEVWTGLEAELSKALNADDELLKKVKARTRIMTDCLTTDKNRMTTMRQQLVEL